MEEIGSTSPAIGPRPSTNLESDSFDMVVSLSPEAQHKAIELTRTVHCEVEFWHTLDPSIVEGNRETRLFAYREVRDGLMARLRDRFGAPRPPVV